MQARHREEVLNVLLAQCIIQTGFAAAPESIVSAPAGRRMPDVIVRFRGLRCAIEGKFAETSASRRDVEINAYERIEAGIAHLAIAVLYPVVLRTTPFDELQSKLRSGRLEFQVSTEAGRGSWRAENLAGILDELRRAQEFMTLDDVVARSVEKLQIGMNQMVRVLSSNAAVSTRLAEILGVHDQ